MAEHRDVIVVGAGVAGVASARALARAGRRVLVLDRGEPWGEASAASAGMLAPQIEAHAGDALLALGLAARDRYPDLATECASAGMDIGFNQAGVAHIAFNAEQEAGLLRQFHALRALGQGTEWLDAGELRRRQPGVSPAARAALLATADGSVDSVALGRALVAQARAAGVEFAREEVCEITSRNARVTGVHGAEQHHLAGTIVFAAGAWASTIAGLPRALAVEPVRGQMAALPWPGSEPPRVLYSDSGYLVPRGGEALVGATMEHVGFEKGVTDSGLQYLRDAAASLLPALADLPFSRTWSGLRPMTPDGLPLIGTDPDLAGLVYATGHGRNGILLGPLTGEIVRDLVVDGRTRWDIAACAVTRFERQ